MEMYFWLFGTAVVFTIMGYYFRTVSDKELVIAAVDSTIDKLVKDGYLKTRGSGKELEILKFEDYDGH